MCESRRDGVRLVAAIVRLLELGRRNQPDGLEKAPVIEPVDPFERGEFDRLDMPPGTAAPDDLGPEQADHRFGQGVVIRVAGAADGGSDADLGQALAVADRQVLGSPVAVMHQAIGVGASVQRLLQCVQNQVCLQGGAHVLTPALN